MMPCSCQFASKYDLVVVSLSAWQKFEKEKFPWVPYLPSMLILSKKERIPVEGNYDGRICL